MSSFYLDACCIIYLVESANPFHQAVAARVLAHRADPSASIVTSRLSRLECRVRPLAKGDHALLSAYEAFFSSHRLDVAEITAAVIERATELRARHGLKTPDAIHVATALESRAETLLTGDASLARCREVRVEVLSP